MAKSLILRRHRHQLSKPDKPNGNDNIRSVGRVVALVSGSACIIGGVVATVMGPGIAVAGPLFIAGANLLGVAIRI